MKSFYKCQIENNVNVLRLSSETIVKHFNILKNIVLWYYVMSVQIRLQMFILSPNQNIF